MELLSNESQQPLPSRVAKARRQQTVGGEFGLAQAQHTVERFGAYYLASFAAFHKQDLRPSDEFSVRQSVPSRPVRKKALGVSNSDLGQLDDENLLYILIRRALERGDLDGARRTALLLSSEKNKDTINYVLKITAISKVRSGRIHRQKKPSLREIKKAKDAAVKRWVAVFRGGSYREADRYKDLVSDVRSNADEEDHCSVIVRNDAVK